MRNSFLLIIMVLSVFSLRAQNSLYVSSGTTLYIGPATSVAVDSLVLTPTAGYTITGSNNLQRSLTPLHTGGNTPIKRVYQWSNTLDPFTGDIAIYYRDNELNGINENQLTLNVHNGTGWNDYITNVIRDNTANVVTTTLSGVVLNELTLATVAGPLPMVWLDVTAFRRNGAIQLGWKTAEEINCAGYQVEKSANGTDWNNLGSLVKAYNTPGPNTYNLTDANLPVAISFYRVRQLDLDGKYVYSKTVSVKSDRSNGVWLYPIPANNVLTVVAGGNLLLKSVNIYNMVGGLVAAVLPQQTASHTINVQSLASGNYTAVILLSDNTTITRNFIKQ